jgi:hypothetical protein
MKYFISDLIEMTWSMVLFVASIALGVYLGNLATVYFLN